MFFRNRSDFKEYVINTLRKYGWFAVYAYGTYPIDVIAAKGNSIFAVSLFFINRKTDISKIKGKIIRKYNTLKSRMKHVPIKPAVIFNNGGDVGCYQPKADAVELPFRSFSFSSS